MTDNRKVKDIWALFSSTKTKTSSTIQWWKFPNPDYPVVCPSLLYSRAQCSAHGAKVSGAAWWESQGDEAWQGKVLLFWGGRKCFFDIMRGMDDWGPEARCINKVYAQKTFPTHKLLLIKTLCVVRMCEQSFILDHVHVFVYRSEGHMIRWWKWKIRDFNFV